MPAIRSDSVVNGGVNISRETLTAIQQGMGILPGWFSPVEQVIVGGATGLHLVYIGGPQPTVSGINAQLSSVQFDPFANDIRGFISFNISATPPAAGSNLLTVTFSKTYPAPVGPYVQIKNVTAGTLATNYNGDYVIQGPFTSGFIVFNTAALPANGTGGLQYWVVG